MAGTVAVGTGTTLTLSGIATFDVFMLSIAHSSISRESLETTHLGTGAARSFIPGDLYDPGSIEVEFQVPMDSPLTNMKIEDIMVDATTTFTVTVNEGGDWAGNGFITDFSWNFPLEELATGTFTLKCSGGITTTN